MLPRRFAVAAAVAIAPAALLVPACEQVPLLAPTGSTITLTASASALSPNQTATIVAQVLEASGTPPHSGTHVSFLTTLGRIEPADVSTDKNGRATVMFFAGNSNGTASISALSGGASTGDDGRVTIAVGTAAVGAVNVSATPSSVSSMGGSTTITAVVLDKNGNPLASTPVTFKTTAGSLSSAVVQTNLLGVATTTLTTSQAAKVTATVGASAGGTTNGGQASGEVDITVTGAPTASIAPTGSITKGIPATFTLTVTPATSNPSPIRSVVVNWGDGNTQDLGASPGTSQTHTYRSDGDFRITVTVTDAAGGTNSSSTSITVLPLGQPTVSVTVTTPGGGVATAAITITPVTGTTIRSTTIDWNDGTVDSLGGGNSPFGSHTYAAPGPKTITIRVTDSADQTSTITRSINVI